MEAVAYIAGEPWSNAPECASPTVGAFLRAWGDALGPDGGDTRQTFKPFIVRLVGSRGGPEQEETRRWIGVDWVMRTYVPAWLQAAGFEDSADRFSRLPELCSRINLGPLTSALEVARDRVRSARPAEETPLTADVEAADWRPGAEAGVLAAVRDAIRASAGTAVPPAWFPEPDIAVAAREVARDAAHVYASGMLAGALGDMAHTLAASQGSVSMATWAVARDALWPIVIQLQASAHQLVHRMLAVHETRVGAAAGDGAGTA
jgi:hypothetical protein